METKVLALTEFKVEGDEGPGTFEGLASAFGTVDSYGDTIDPGAYKETIPEFLTRGFLGWGHDWADPIGYFTHAEETPKGLVVKGEFHSDPQAQVYRQRVKERAAAGKFMGMSIGYEALDFEFRTMEERQVRALTRIKLHEVSLVTVPAERNSHVTNVKDSLGGDIPDLFRRVKERFEIALGIADEPWSDEYRAQLSELSAELDELHPQLKELLARGAVVIEPEPTPELDEKTAALVTRFLSLNAAYGGVGSTK